MNEGISLLEILIEKFGALGMAFIVVALIIVVHQLWEAFWKR